MKILRTKNFANPYNTRKMYDSVKGAIRILSTGGIKLVKPNIPASAPKKSLVDNVVATLKATGRRGNNRVEMYKSANHLAGITDINGKRIPLMEKIDLKGQIKR